MRHSKFGLKAFGLAVMAAFGLMAFTAVAAQAESLNGTPIGAKFRVAGLTTLTTNIPVTGAQEGAHGLLLVPGRNLTVLCKTGKLTEAKLLHESEALGKVLFEECKTWNLALTEELPCTIFESAGVGKEMITATALVLPKKHESELFLLFEGDPATAAFTTFILTGGECPLPGGAVAVKGSVVALITDGSTERITQLITFSEPIQKLFQVKNAKGEVEGDKLLYGTFESFLGGSATVELTGSHAGKTWSVI